MSQEFVVLGRIALAGVLAAIIGFEREVAGKSAGLRTHMMVAMSAALFVGAGEMAVRLFPDQGGDALQYDPIRVIQAIVIGIGFLGSGIVFVNQERTRSRGLTTAASIWATSGIGIVTGLGLYVVSAGATILFVAVLRLLIRFDQDDE